MNPILAFLWKPTLKKEFPKPLHCPCCSPVDYEKLYQNVDREQRFCWMPARLISHTRSALKDPCLQSFGKILVILRNPMERMISHYKMNVGLGKEKNLQQIVRKNSHTIKMAPCGGTIIWRWVFYDAGLEGFKQYFKEVMVWILMIWRK